MSSEQPHDSLAEMVIRSNRWFGGRPDADRLNNYRVTMQLVNGYFGLIAREPSIHLPSVCESEIEESESQDSDSSSSHGHHSDTILVDATHEDQDQATATTVTDTILVDTTPQQGTAIEAMAIDIIVGVGGVDGVVIIIEGDLATFMDSISNIDKTHILPTIRVQGFPTTVNSQQPQHPVQDDLLQQSSQPLPSRQQVRLT